MTTLYNPGEKEKDVLIDEFVVRTKEFDKIFGDIKTSKMEKPQQHYLLVGQRGSGKTTLLQRLKYAIQDDEKLNKWLVPIAFSEEQYNISELSDLWLRIAEFLEDYYGMDDLVSEIQKQYNSDNFEKKSLDILLSNLRKNKKKIVIFIDNIGDLLKKFKEVETRRLREVLQTIAEIRLIAASPILLGDQTDYKKTLYQFFKVEQLKGLDLDEMKTLLLKLGELHNTRKSILKIIQKSPERIEILRRLTGGVVRTVVMMYNVFVENTENNTVSDLQKILDEATPLYKHKMDDLPTQQQKIIDAVALKWEAISTKEIAGKLRLESKIISAQLRQLEKDQWIEKLETSTKNNLYQLKERFFNIWYLMRYGRKDDRNRIIWLVKFMQNLFEKNEIEKRIQKLITKIQKGNIDANNGIFWNEIYLMCDNISPFSKLYLLFAVNQSNLKENNLVNSKIDALYNAESFWEEVFTKPQNINKNDLELFKQYLLDNSSDYTNTMILSALGIILGDINKYKSQIDWWKKFLNSYEKDDPTGFLDFLRSKINFENDEGEYNQIAINKGNPIAIGLSAAIFFQAGYNKKKALEIIGKSNDKESMIYKLSAMRIFVWANKFDLGAEYFESSFNEKVKVDKVAPYLMSYLLLLIAKEQYNTALKYFANFSGIKNALLPVYYALLSLMKGKQDDEYLRMPPEIKDTVNDVLKQVEDYKEKYK